MKAKTSFSEKLYALREMNHESQADVAYRTGLTQTSISRWERDSKKHQPKPSQMLALARHFRVPLDWLADDTQAFPPPFGASEEEKVIFRLVNDLGLKEAYRRLIQAAPEVVMHPQPQPPGPDQSRDDGQPYRRRHRRGGA